MAIRAIVNAATRAPGWSVSEAANSKRYSRSDRASDTSMRTVSFNPGVQVSG